MAQGIAECTRRHFFVAMIMLVMLIGCAGCASSPTLTVDQLATAPPDFSIDLTVTGGRHAKRDEDTASPAGRFVVFADGSLHHGTAPERGARWLPDRTRVLDRRQMAGLWSLLQQSGLDDSSNSDPVRNFNLLNPPRDQTLCLLAVTGDGHRWTFVRESEDAIDPAFDRLLTHLAALAWTDDDTVSRYADPRRYDFGDDPYAPYRR